MSILKNISGKNNHEHLNTIIGENSVFEGELNIQGSVRIDGRLSGNLIATGNLTVGSSGEIESPIIHCQSAHIAGNIQGDLISPQKVYLTNTARVNGSITTQVLVIEEGAKFNGKSDMIGSDFSNNPNIQI